MNWDIDAPPGPDPHPHDSFKKKNTKSEFFLGVNGVKSLRKAMNWSNEPGE